MTKANRENLNAEKLKRTRVVARPGNTQIRTSRDIRREFNKNHKEIVIKNTVALQHQVLCSLSLIMKM